MISSELIDLLLEADQGISNGAHAIDNQLIALPCALIKSQIWWRVVRLWCICVHKIPNIVLPTDSQTGSDSLCARTLPCEHSMLLAMV